MKRIINIEDTNEKHMAIRREVQRYMTAIMDWETSAEAGLKRIEEAISEGRPYDLLITDMHFPLNGELDEHAGEYVINEIKNRGINIPVIVFSTKGYPTLATVGHLRYNHRNGEVMGDIREMLQQVLMC